MNWETPMLVEIKMDAEISAYQEDQDDRPLPRPAPPLADGAAAPSDG